MKIDKLNFFINSKNYKVVQKVLQNPNTSISAVYNVCFQAVRIVDAELLNIGVETLISRNAFASISIFHAAVMRENEEILCSLMRVANPKWKGDLSDLLGECFYADSLGMHKLQKMIDEFQ